MNNHNSFDREGSGTPPRIPQHRLLRKIGRGSYGEVWLALNVMNKWAAIKVVRLQRGTNEAGYEREFRGLKRYDDLGSGDARLLPIRDVGRDDASGFFYYAMELADNQTTHVPLRRPESGNDAEIEALAASYRPRTLSAELQQRGRLPPDECITHGIELAECLESLHSAKLVHRDIKPSNVIFVGGRAKLADVGLVSGPDATMVTGLGTMGFVPPEGHGRPAADLYSLGRVLFMMSTGLPAGNVMLEPEDWDLIPESERNLLSEIRAVYDRACDCDARDRQSSVSVFREELEMLRDKQSVCRSRRLELEVAFWRRIFKVFGVITAAVIGLLVWYQWRQAQAHRDSILALETRQLVRMGARQQGWSERDMASVHKAAHQRIDPTVLRQGVAVLSGLDLELLGSWLHTEASSAAFSMDGRLAVAGFKLYPASLVTPPNSRIECASLGEGKTAWLPSGEPILLKVETNVLAFRDLHTGRLRQNLSPRKNGYQPTGVVAISRDGSLAAGGFSRNNSISVNVWDAKSGTVLGEVVVNANAIEFSPDDNLMAVGCSDGKIAIYRAKSLELEATLPAALEPNPIQCLAFGENRRVPLDGAPRAANWILAAGDRGTGIVVWDLSTKVPRTFCRGSHWEVSAVAIDPKGQFLVSAGRLTTRFWDLASGALVLEVKDHNGSNTRAIAISNDGTTLAVGSTSESGPAELTLWRMIPDRGIGRLGGLTTPVRKVVWSKDSNRIAALSDQWLLGVWEIAGGRLMRTFEVPAGVYADSADIAFSPEANRVAYTAGARARLFDLDSGATVARWTLPQGKGSKLKFDENGILNLALIDHGSHSADQGLWKTFVLPIGSAPLASQRQTDSSYRPISMAFVAGASRLVLYTRNVITGRNAMRLLELATGRELWCHWAESTNTWSLMRTDPFGEFCVLTGREGAAEEILDLADGRRVTKVPTVVTLGPKGRELGAIDTQISGLGIDSAYGPQVWLIQSLDGSQGPVPLATDSVVNLDTPAISADGRFAAWGCMDGSIGVAEIKVVREAIQRIRSGTSPTTSRAKY